MRILIENTINEEEIRAIYRKDVHREIEIVKFGWQSMMVKSLHEILTERKYFAVYLSDEDTFNAANEKNLDLNILLYHNE